MPRIRRRRKYTRTITQCSWRSVRIFFKSPTAAAYPQALADIVQPFATKFPATPFFFSRYGPIPRGVDDSDTRIDELPDDFWFMFADGTRRHHSLRLRFAALRREEDFIVQRLNLLRSRYWKHSLDDYDPLSFAEGRVYVGANGPRKAQRANYVGELLCANSRYVLDTIYQDAVGMWRFEENPNWHFPMSFAFPLHMLGNTYLSSEVHRLGGTAAAA